MSSYTVNKSCKDTIYDELKDLMIKENEEEEKINIKRSINNNNRKIIDTYIIVDSFNKIRSSDTSQGEFKWNIFKGIGSREECVNIYEDLGDVIEICMGSFYMPILEDLSYNDPKFNISVGTATLEVNNFNNTMPMTLKRSIDSTITGQYPFSLLTPGGLDYVNPWINSPYTQIPFSNRFTVQLLEAGYYSYNNNNNTRYNFEFDALYGGDNGYNPNFLLVNPINSSDKWDNFNFNDPIRSLTSISLVFRNPDNRIKFEPDIFYNAVIDTEVDIFGVTWIVFYNRQFTVHNLSMGDRIYIKNFVPKLSNGTFNNLFPKYLTDYINRIEGHVVSGKYPSHSSSTYYGDRFPVPTYKFGTDPAIKLLNPLDVNITNSLPGSCDIYIAKRRLRIPMRFKSIKNANI